MAVPRSRVLALMKLQSTLFNTLFNPTGARQGSKILRQRLIGASVADYYPRKGGGRKELMRQFPGWETYDEAEEDRLEMLGLRKMRGKQAPKKKRSKGESKVFTKRK